MGEGELRAGMEAGNRVPTYSWTDCALLNSGQQCEWHPLGLYTTVALGKTIQTMVVVWVQDDRSLD